MMDGLKLKPIKRTVTKGPVIGKQKKKFNFKTTRKAINNSVKVADWLTDLSVQEVADLWKKGAVQKKLSGEDARLFTEIKHCLTR